MIQCLITNGYNQMQSKEQLQYQEQRSNSKSISDSRKYHSFDRSQPIRNKSLESQIHIDETRARKEMNRLRDKVKQLEQDNLQLQNMKIEQDDQLNIWMDKAKRLNQQLRLLEQQTLKGQNYSKSNDESLIKQISVLKKQAQQLAIAKVQLEEALNNQILKNKTLQQKQRERKQVQEQVESLQLRNSELEELLNKSRAALERSETRLTRNEIYIGELEKENQNLQKQLYQQLKTLEQEKITLLSRQKLQRQHDVNELEIKLAEANSKIEEMKNEVLNIAQTSSKGQHLKLEIQQLAFQVQKLRDKLRERQFYVKEIEDQKEKLVAQLASNRNEIEHLKIQNEQLQRNRIVQPHSRIVKDSPLQRQLFYQEDKLAQTISYQKEHTILGNQALQKQLMAQISFLERKVRQQRAQIERLAQQLQKSHQQERQLRINIKQKSELSTQQLDIVDYSRRFRDQEEIIASLTIEMNKWKNYRQSEEDQARREMLSYKRRVEDLQQLLNQEKALRDAALQKEKENSNMAMDEIQVEYRKLIAELENQLLDKQNQLDQSKSLAVEYSLAKKQAQNQLQRLSQQMLLTKNQLSRLQDNSKKEQQAVKARYNMEAELRQTKIRYEKILDEKVIEIQRLKLLIAQLQEEPRKNISLKRQLESAEAAIKQLQREDIQKTDKLRIMNRTIENLESEMRSHKNIKEDLNSQLKTMQKQLNRLERDEKLVKQLEKQLLFEKSKVARLNEEKQKLNHQRRNISQQYNSTAMQVDRLKADKNKEQSNAWEWREKYQASENRLSQKNQTISRLKEQISKLELQVEKANKNAVVIEEQKRVINSSKMDIQQKNREIQLLLEKIEMLELQHKENTIKYIQGEDLRRSMRLNRLEHLARMVNIPNIDEDRTIEAITEYVSSILSRTTDLELQLKEYKNIVIKLEDDKQNLGRKYQKYKNIAMEYKQRKQVQRNFIKNTYRFNDEVISHCQNIIRGDNK